jgi:hypothetical protein
MQDLNEYINRVPFFPVPLTFFSINLPENLPHSFFKGSG